MLDPNMPLPPMPARSKTELKVEVAIPTYKCVAALAPAGGGRDGLVFLADGSLVRASVHCGTVVHTGNPNSGNPNGGTAVHRQAVFGVASSMLDLKARIQPEWRWRVVRVTISSFVTTHSIRPQDI